MSLYRDNYEAALARATSLERELELLRRDQRNDRETIAALVRQLRAKQLELLELSERCGPSLCREVHQPARISNAVAVFVLAVLSLLVVHPLGPLAWVASNRELRRINAGLSDSRNRPMVVAGKVLGITATVIFVVSLLFFLFAAAAPCHIGTGAPCGF